MDFLEWHYSKPSLSPSSEQARKHIHEIGLAHKKLHDPYLRTLSYATIFFCPEKRQAIDLDAVLQRAKQYPNKERGKFLERLQKVNSLMLSP